MRSSIIKSVFHKELTELLRNRRSLMVMFGVPLLLYPALTIALASLQSSKQNQMAQRVAVVGVVNSPAAPKLRDLLGEDQYKISPVDESPDQADAKLKAATIDAFVIVPGRYETLAIAGKDVELDVHVDGSRPSNSSVEHKLDKVLLAYQEWIVQQRLAAHGLPATMAAEPKRKTTNIATADQTFGVFLAEALPLLLLLTGMLGALYPALSATTNERELGTLETLLVTPATRDELLTAKAGVVLISGLLTALLNMVSMSLVFWRVLSEAKGGAGGFSIDPRALALSYLAAIPTLIFFTALVLMAGLLARNMREANAYATPLMMVPILSMGIGIADPALTPGLLVTPVANTTLIIREVLTGHAKAGQFVLAFVSSGLYAGLVLSLAGRLFSNEQLVNPAWEPLSLRGFARRRVRRARWPAVDEALVLFSVSLLLNFYLTPSWANRGLIPVLAGVEILLIAGPAVLFSWLGSYPWREVFSIRRPSAAAMTGAVLLGLGTIPLVAFMSYLQELWHILPANKADMEGMEQFFRPTLLAHPFITPIVVGLLAGVCEELLFRGPIQAALVRRLPVAAALIAGGLLFAGAHVDLSGLPPRLVLGVILGWVVLRSGSIFPAMVMHAVYDATSVGWDAYQMIHAGGSQGAETNMPIGLLVGGGVACVVGWMLVRRSAALPGKSAYDATDSSTASFN